MVSVPGLCRAACPRKRGSLALGRRRFRLDAVTVTDAVRRRRGRGGSCGEAVPDVFRKALRRRGGRCGQYRPRPGGGAALGGRPAPAPAEAAPRGRYRRARGAARSGGAGAGQSRAGGGCRRRPGGPCHRRYIRSGGCGERSEAAAAAAPLNAAPGVVRRERASLLPPPRLTAVTNPLPARLRRALPSRAEPGGAGKRSRPAPAPGGATAGSGEGRDGGSAPGAHHGQPHQPLRGGDQEPEPGGDSALR